VGLFGAANGSGFWSAFAQLGKFFWICLCFGVVCLCFDGFWWCVRLTAAGWRVWCCFVALFVWYLNGKSAGVGVLFVFWCCGCFFVWLFWVGGAAGQSGSVFGLFFGCLLEFCFGAGHFWWVLFSHIRVFSEMAVWFLVLFSFLLCRSGFFFFCWTGVIFHVWLFFLV